MAGKVAYNAETGEAVRFDGNSWVPTKVATHERTGAKVAFDGNEWVSVGGEKQPAQSEIGGVVDAFTQGATFGFGDELTGLEAGVLGRTPEGGWFDYSQSFGDRYKAARDAERTQMQAYGKQSPVLSTGAEIAGAVASPVNKVIAPMMAAPTLAGRIGRGAAVGAGTGAVTGSGHAKEISDIPKSAAMEATLGVVVGGASPAVIEGVTRAGRGVIENLVNRYAGNTSKAQQKLFTAVKNAGNGDYQAGLQKVEGLIKNGNADDALVDMLGMEGLRMARAVANVPGKSSEIIDDFVQGRMAGRGSRLGKASDILDDSDYYGALDDIIAQRSRASSPLYDEAFAPVSDKAGKVFAQWDERLQQFLDDPLIKSGLAKGMRIQQLEALAQGRKFNPIEYAVKGFDDTGNVIIEGTPNLRTMDAAKRGLDDIIEGYRDPVTGKVNLDEYGRAVEKVRKSLVAKLDEMTTDVETGVSKYAEARAAYAGPSQIKDALQRGRSFMRGDAEMIGRMLSRMNEGQKQAYRIGVRRELSKLINTDTQSAINKFADKKTDFWNRLKAVFHDEKQFNAFKKEIGAEVQRARNEQFISPKSGSQTTPLAQDIAELQRVPNAILDAAQNLATGNRVGAVSGLLRAPIDYLRRPDQKTALTLAEALTSRGQGAMDVLQSLQSRQNAAQLANQLLPRSANEKLARAAMLGALTGGQ